VGSTVFSKTISEEPLAPAVRMESKSERFEDVVRWVIYATFLAEERGINTGNVVSKRNNPSSLNSEEKRLLGVEGDLGEKLGLDNDWAFDVIRLVGSHEDIYQRNFSGLPLGNNQPPPNGLMFSPPFN
jgi:general L-amino acid transport system substrate-binding protein